MKPAVDTAQTTWELERLVGLVEYEWPHRTLEIGIWEGGTLWHWLQISREVVAVDDTMRPPGVDTWIAWAREADCDLRLIHGSSHDPAIIEKVHDAAPYDFVFIDADHTYNSVKQDWETYREMVEPGGLVAFHDITSRPDYGVAELWGEIKQEPGIRTLELVENSGRFNGIGVVYL